MDSCSQTIPIDEKVKILDNFCQKMTNSGHSVKSIRVILVGGIKGYKRKLARSMERGEPVHRSSHQSAGTRRTKKLLAKSRWFKEDAKELETTTTMPEAGPRRPGPPKGRGAGARVARERESSQPKQQEGRPPGGKPLKTTTVLFVEFSKGGALQKTIKECLEKITPMLGFKTRIAEKGGTPLSSLLSNKDPWSGVACGREACRTCAQNDDKKEPFMRRNIVYESECGTCNPPGSRKEAD